jgi:hypothetical protein
MKYSVGVALFVAACVTATASAQDAQAVVDKAIKAMGGEKAEAVAWKARGRITFGDNTSEMTSRVTAQGPDRFRSEFEGEFGGNTVQGVTVLAGDKGWRKFNDNAMPLDSDALANQKRASYLQLVPMTPAILKGPGFKLGSTSEESVGGKPAVVVNVTGPDGKDFKVAFDKEGGLPVKLTARVAGFQGNEFTQETTYANYKDFGGLKRPAKIESLRDGQRFLEQEITEFKVMDKAGPGTFDEPS